MTPKFRHTAARWIDVTGLSVASGVVFLVIWHTLQFIDPRWFGLPSSWGITLQILVFSVLVAVPLALMKNVIAARPAAIGSLFRYPPCWIAVIPSLLTGFAILSFDAEIWFYASLAIAIGYVVALLTALPSWLRSLQRESTLARSSTESTASATETPLSLATIEAWLGSEDRIVNDSDDWLDASSVAERIATKIKAAPRVALLGAFGTGKSSVIALTQSRLQTAGYRSVIVDGWGPTTDDVPEVILRSIVSELGKHVDVLQLVNLPARYRAALTGSKSAPAAVLNELATDRPAEVLSRLDSVLGALGSRLIVFLEDLDRYAGPETIQGVGALLDRLRHLKSVGFVIAVDATRATAIDIIRLCEYSESLLPLEIRTTRRLLDATVRLCESKAAGIIPLDPKRLDAWKLPSQQPEPEHRAIDIFGESDPRKEVAAFVSLARTPRNLKSILRQTVSAWSNLKGEVDLPELLAEECLRVVSPSVWQLVGDEVARFRNEPSIWDRGTEKENTVREAAQQELAHRVTTAAVNDRAHPSKVLSLISFLFPSWQSAPRRVGQAGQYVRDDKPTDYWRRMVRQTIVEPVSDQEVLAKLRDWQKNELNGLPDLLIKSEHASNTFEKYGHLVPPNQLLPIAATIHAKMRKSDGRRAALDRTMAAIVLWRMAIGERRPGIRRFVMSEISQALNVSLRLANDIAHYWTAEDKVYGISRKRIYTYMRLLFHKRFENLGRLANILPPSDDVQHFYLLYNLIKSHHAGGRSDVASQWTWFTDQLASSTAYPMELATQLAHLMSKEIELAFHERELRFDEDFTRSFIPDDAKRQHILRTILTSWNATTYSQSARDSFTKLLKDISNSLTEGTAK